jgi:excisionase family DNA binding protein
MRASIDRDLESRLSKPFYSPADVAELADLSPSTILNYIHAGRLSAVRLSERTYRIPRRAVLRLLAPELVAPPEMREEPDVEADLADADQEGIASVRR